MNHKKVTAPDEEDLERLRSIKVADLLLDHDRRLNKLEKIRFSWVNVIGYFLASLLGMTIASFIAGIIFA